MFFTAQVLIAFKRFSIPQSVKNMVILIDAQAVTINFELHISTYALDYLFSYLSVG
jgi:hypothetical protein